MSGVPETIGTLATSFGPKHDYPAMMLQIKGMELEMGMFNQAMAATKPMRTMEAIGSAALLFNAIKGPGEYNYEATPGLEGFLGEMNKEFEYTQSEGLTESIEAANRATERSGIAQGPGGATQAAVARGTAGMTYADFLGQQGRFDTKQMAKGVAKAEDYWKDRGKTMEEWRATKIDPFMGIGTNITSTVPGTYANSAGSIGNSFVNLSNTMAAGTINSQNQMANMASSLGSAGSQMGNALAYNSYVNNRNVHEFDPIYA